MSKIKRTKKWLTWIKENVKVDSSKKQPYRTRFIPYALKNWKDFQCKTTSHSFKNQGGAKFFLLERAKKAYKDGVYPAVEGN